ncbi:MAG: hypothetical protein ABS79_00360 [Planctomycetes bacterium SCN 63-9]|nr:MAG: hypothetical protein ABS79_00360 [Planctomycetes bacterium SCN 63-9]
MLKQNIAQRGKLVGFLFFAVLDFLLGPMPRAMAWQENPPRSAEVVTRILLKELERAGPNEKRTYEVRSNPILQRVIAAGLKTSRGAEAARTVAAGGQGVDAIGKAVRSLADEGLKSISSTTPPKDLLKLAAAHEDTSKQLLGVIPEKSLRTKLTTTANGGVRPDPKAPKFDWRSLKLVTRARSQGECGCCWAFGTLAAFESAFAISNRGKLIHASEQHVLSCSQVGNCESGWWAFDFLQKKGVASAFDVKFQGADGDCPDGIKPRFRAVAWGYVSSINTIPSVSELKKALCLHGPLVVAVNNTIEFTAYSKGIFDEHDPGTLEVPVDHAVTIVGWDDTKLPPGSPPDRTVWAVKNSWGETWGVEGFMEIASGSNSIGYGAAWVEAVDLDNPPDLIRLRSVTPDAEQLPAVGFAREGIPAAKGARDSQRKGGVDSPALEELPATFPAGQSPSR